MVGARLAPSAGLTEDERAAWVLVVNSRSPDYFRPEHTHLLEQYVRQKTICEDLTQDIRKTRDRMKKGTPKHADLMALSRLLDIRAKAIFTLCRLAKSLRVSPSSQYSKKKTGGSRAVTQGGGVGASFLTTPKKTPAAIHAKHGAAVSGRPNGVKAPWQ